MKGGNKTSPGHHAKMGGLRALIIPMKNYQKKI
jgi:hypothetical protein